MLDVDIQSLYGLYLLIFCVDALVLGSWSWRSSPSQGYFLGQQRTPLSIHFWYTHQSIQGHIPSSLSSIALTVRQYSRAPSHPRDWSWTTWSHSCRPEPMKLFKLFNPRLALVSTCLTHSFPQKPRWRLRLLPYTSGPAGGPCLLLLGFCGYKLLPSWQLYLYLWVLPYLIKTNLRYKYDKVLREMTNYTLGTKFQISNVFLDFSVTNTVPLV